MRNPVRSNKPKLTPAADVSHKKNLIIIGRIGDAFGVHGWSHLTSYTDPHDNIFHYKNWHIETRPDHFEPLKLESHKAHGKGFVIKIARCEDRDQALLLKGKAIAIERAELPALKNDEYYWSDLIGFNVTNTKGESLGTIDHLFETGSNDVIVTSTNHYIPYLSNVVKTVDLEGKMIVVEWEL